MGRKKTSLGGILLVGFLLLVVPFWYIFLPIAALLLLVWILQCAIAGSKKSEEKEAVIKLGKELQRALGRLSSGKTAATRATNCGKALETLRALGNFESARDYILNMDEVRVRLEVVQKWLPLIELMTKVIKHRESQDRKKEVKSLKDLLSYLAKKEPTKEEWQHLCEMCKAWLPTPLTTAVVEARLREIQSSIDLAITAS